MLLLILYDAAVIQWIILCLKNGMTTHVIIFWFIHVMSLTVTMLTIQ